MSKGFDNLVERITCQMRRMLEERRRFNVLVKEFRELTGKGIADK